MDFKPGDFFFTVVEFFSIILPGTTVLALVWNHAWLMQITPILQSEVAETSAFLIVAYFLGQVLTALASWLDKLYDKSKMPKKKRRRNAELSLDVRQLVAAKLNVTVPEEESILTWTDAFLRSVKEIDISHLDHLEAESKFFRSMLLVLPLYVVFFFIKLQVVPAIIVIVMIPLAAWRYADRRVTRTMETYRTFIAGEALGIIKRQKDN